MQIGNMLVKMFKHAHRLGKESPILKDLDKNARYNAQFNPIPPME
jgi:hypothetical protein